MVKFFILFSLFISSGYASPGLTPGCLRPMESSYELFKIYDDTVLHMAAANGDIELVKDQLKRNMGVNIVNQQGYTPLDCAVIMNWPEIVELLKEHGAVPSSDWLPLPHELVGVYSQDKSITLIKRTGCMLTLASFVVAGWYWWANRSKKKESP